MRGANMIKKKIGHWQPDDAESFISGVTGKERGIFMYLEETFAKEHFLGTGESNAAGQDLITFLKAYDPFKYKNPCNTVDSIIFLYEKCAKKEAEETADIGKIKKVLLIKRGNHPSIGWWALPGGFVEYDEDICDAALRELKEETGVDNVHVAQLKSYGAPDRDPRARIITTAFVSLVEENSIHAKAGDDASDSGYFTIRDVLVKKEETGSRVYEQHQMTLENEATGVKTETTVAVTYDTNDIWQEKTYQVETTKGLAADHGAIILEAYHYALANIKAYKNEMRNISANESGTK